MLEQISNVTYAYIFYQFIDRYTENLRWARGIDAIIDEEDEFMNVRQPWIRKLVMRKAMLLQSKHDQLKALLQEDGDLDEEEVLREDPSLRKLVMNKAESIVKRHF